MYIFLFALPVLIHASSPFYAIDIGDQTVSSNQMTRLANTYSLVFIEALGPDGKFVTSLCDNIKKSIGHMSVDIYMTPKFSDQCAAQITDLQTELSKCTEVNFKSIWLKLLPESGWSSTTTADNIACIEQMITEATNFEAIGIHSSKAHWDLYLGPDYKYTELHKVQAIWYSTSYNSQANMDDWGKGFGGFTKANVKQFQHNVTLDANQYHLTNRDIWIPTGDPKQKDENGRPIIGGHIFAVSDLPYTLVETTTTQEASTAQPTSTVTQTESTAQPTSTVAQTESTAQPTSTVTQSESTVQPTSTVAQTESTAQPTSTVTQTESTVQPTSTVTQETSTAQPTSTVTQTESTAQPTSTVTQTESTVQPTSTVTQTESTPQNPATVTQ